LLGPIEPGAKGPLGCPFSSELSTKKTDAAGVMRAAARNWAWDDRQLDPEDDDQEFDLENEEEMTPYQGSKKEIKEVQRAHRTDKVGFFTWYQAERTLQYVIFGIEMAHLHRGIRNCTLRLLAGVPISRLSVWQKVQGTAAKMSSTLVPELLAYRQEEGLVAQLGGLSCPCAGRGSQQVTQKDYFACFDPAAEKSQPSSDPEHTSRRIRGLDLEKNGVHMDADPDACWSMSNGVCGLALILVSQYLNLQFTERVGKLCAGSGSKVHAAPPKTYGRTMEKVNGDFKESGDCENCGCPEPKVQHVKDVMRCSLQAPTAADQLKNWQALLDSDDFEVLSLKNTFALPDAEAEATGGMMQLLASVVYTGRDASGEPLTFAGMVADKKKLSAAVAAVSEREEHLKVMDGLMLTVLEYFGGAFLSEKPVRMVAEVQFHLDWYVNQRKKTHLWYKIQRAETPSALRRDCAAYRTKE